MNRLPDWQRRLTEYVSAAQVVSATHCGYFVGRAVEVMTGEKVIPETVTGRKRADIVALRNLGHDDIVSFIATVLPETPRARPGDVVVLRDNDDEPTVGILQGRLVYVMSSEGLVMMSPDTITKAFRV